MKNISTANKGLKALAKENPALVENKFGYDVPGYMYGGIANFMVGGSVYGPASLSNPTLISGSPISTPDIMSGQDIDFSDVFNKEAVDEAQEDLDDFDFDELEETLEDGIDAGTRDPEEIADIIAKKKTPKEKMQIMGEMLEMIGASSDFSPLVQGQIVKGSQASIPEIRRYAGGGIASMMPMEMREGGMTYNPFLDGIEDRIMFNYNDDRYGFDPRDYLKNVLGIEDIDSDFGLSEEEIAEREAERAAATLARAYGAPSSGITSLSMGYGDTRPGASISIDAKDKTPDVYKFYPSEVSKIYAQAKGVPFSPLVAPPKEATYVEALQPRRIASQLYAKDGTFVERDQLVTGPGGERGDQIPAMLSDGEFVTNSAAVRGMGIAAGADPNDEYEQRLMGAREMYKMQKFGEEIAKMLR